MKLDRAGIEGVVPHSGSMVLLDSVIDWDASQIDCSAAAPGAEHPLARHGSVPSLAAVEYAAQAAAVHGSLIEQSAVSRPGLLAKLSDVQLHAAYIPIDRGPLSVNARLLSRVALGCLYEFRVVCAGETLAHGRLMVAFAAAATR